TDVPGDDRVARTLRQQATENGTPPADGICQNIQRIEHPIDIERGRLDRNQEKVGRSETAQRGLRPEARSVDNYWTCRGEPVRRLPSVLACVLNNVDAAERPFTGRQSRDRALRIGIDNGRMLAQEMPMHSQATRNGTFAAAAFHAGDRYDRTRHLVGLRIQSDESMRFDSIVFWAKFLPSGNRHSAAGPRLKSLLLWQPAGLLAVARQRG